MGLVDTGNMQVAIGDLAALELRLRDPGQNVVITTNVGNEMHRLAASGVAVTRFAVPLLLRQTRQHFFHVQPFIRIQPLVLGQFARIFEVTAANVVGRES